MVSEMDLVLSFLLAPFSPKGVDDLSDLFSIFTYDGSLAFKFRILQALLRSSSSSRLFFPERSRRLEQYILTYDGVTGVQIRKFSIFFGYFNRERISRIQTSIGRFIWTLCCPICLGLFFHQRKRRLETYILTNVFPNQSSIVSFAIGHFRYNSKM